MRIVSKVDVDTHLSEQEVITDAFSNNEANTQEIERVKIDSNKICTRDDQATDKKDVRQEIQPCRLRKGNMELIDLKNFLSQCPSCIPYLRTHLSADADK